MAGLVSCETVLLLLNAIFTMVFLKWLVIFHICGELYVKVAHLVSIPVVVGGFRLGCSALYSLFLSD